MEELLFGAQPKKAQSRREQIDLAFQSNNPY
jgi:hypothetical protein